MFDGQNAYITASYLVSALVFIALIGWVMMERYRQKKTLAHLESALRATAIDTMEEDTDRDA